MILTTIGFCCGINVFEEVLHAAGTFFLQLLFDSNDTILKVNAVPCQAKDFALPHGGEQIDFINSFKGVSFDGFEEKTDFVVL